MLFSDLKDFDEKLRAFIEALDKLEMKSLFCKPVGTLNSFLQPPEKSRPYLPRIALMLGEKVDDSVIIPFLYHNGIRV